MATQSEIRMARAMGYGPSDLPEGYFGRKRSSMNFKSLKKAAALVGFLTLGGIVYSSSSSGSTEELYDIEHSYINTASSDIRILFDGLGKVESPRMGYDAYHHAARIQPPKPISQMTLGELKVYDAKVLEATKEYNIAIEKYNKGRPKNEQKKFLSYSTAAGKYQQMGSTRKSLQKLLGIPDEAVFDEFLQDLMATYLLVELGMTEYTRGEIQRDEIHSNIAKVWAGVPAYKSGDSAFEGINGNTAHFENGFTYNKFAKLLESINHGAGTLTYTGDPTYVEGNIFLLEKQACLKWLKFYYQCSLEGIIIKANETYRPQERQDHLADSGKGVTSTRNSKHTKGRAVDFLIKSVNGKSYGYWLDDADQGTKKEIWNGIEKIAEKCGGKTGNQWKSPHDPQHIQF